MWQKSEWLWILDVGVQWSVPRNAFECRWQNPDKRRWEAGFARDGAQATYHADSGGNALKANTLCYCQLHSHSCRRRGAMQEQRLTHSVHHCSKLRMLQGLNSKTVFGLIYIGSANLNFKPSMHSLNLRGKRGYEASEWRSGRMISVKVDVYSLGGVFSWARHGMQVLWHESERLQFLDMDVRWSVHRNGSDVIDTALEEEKKIWREGGSASVCDIPCGLWWKCSKADPVLPPPPPKDLPKTGMWEKWLMADNWVCTAQFHFLCIIDQYIQKTGPYFRQFCSKYTHVATFKTLFPHN